jgi:hypothetical protein
MGDPWETKTTGMADMTQLQQSIENQQPLKATTQCRASRRGQTTTNPMGHTRENI